MLYPIATETRMLFDLNGIWKFKIENNPESANPENVLITDRYMAVPGAFNDQSADKDIRFFTGYFWYEREFSVTEEMLNKRLVLRFGAVTHEAWVYINGKKVAYHKGGFLPFEAVINDVAVIGTNRVSVLANNLLDYTTVPVGKLEKTITDDGVVRYHTDENFDFFNYAGIIRPVRLYTTSHTYLKDIVLNNTVNDDNAVIHAKLSIEGEYDKAVVTIFDECGDEVARKEIEKGNATEVNLHIESVKLWQPLNSYLYNVNVRLYKDNGLEDSYTEPFGVRTVEVRDAKFLINGKPFYFKGFGKHEDTYLNGRGLNEITNVTDLNIMKQMGANSYRTSHYPYSEEMMRLSDRMGFVVIDETPAVGLFEGFTVNINMKGDNTWEVMDTYDAHERSLRELIARDKNHACVVMWSIANEAATHQEGAKEYFEPLFKLAHKLDVQKRSRTQAHIMVAPADQDLVMGMTDVICLNRYYGWYVTLGDMKLSAVEMRKDLDTWCSRFPDKPIMYTEYGADTVSGLHSLYNIPFTEEYQIEVYEMMAEVMDEYPNFIGEQTWNFADFETKIGIGRVQGNKKGVFTRAREPKAIAHWLKKRWSSIPDFYYKN
jgi:beta-glucuronidase